MAALVDGQTQRQMRREGGKSRGGKFGPRGTRQPSERYPLDQGLNLDLTKMEARAIEELPQRQASSCASTEEASTSGSVAEELGSLSGAISEAATADLENVDVLSDPANCEMACKIKESLTVHREAFTAFECTYIEFLIDQMVAYAKAGGFEGPYTVDSTEKRSKYFFGNGYTYGRGQRGREALLPLGAVDPIPNWIEQFVILPLVQRGIIKSGWVNSVVLNDYSAGGCIVAHVDPPQLFARPILTASFFDSGSLVFGASFDPERTQAPVFSQYLSRGCGLMLDGFSANEVTHGMRPEDMTGSRRVSIVLRHVRDDAPKLWRDTPMKLHEHESLIRQVQGQWRDARRHFIFEVLPSLRVMVYRVLEDQSSSEASSENATTIGTALHATWDLQPDEFGIVCNHTILYDTGVEKDALFWRRHHVQLSANNVNDGVTWHRLEEDFAARLDVFVKRRR